MKREITSARKEDRRRGLAKKVRDAKDYIKRIARERKKVTQRKHKLIVVYIVIQGS